MELAKASVVMQWLPDGLVRVHIDATREGVVVPREFRKKENLILEWGFNLPKQIVDMKIDQEAISGTLSFSDGFVFCIVPWHAVFAVTSPSLGEAKVWLNDASPKIQRQILKRAGEQANAKIQQENANARRKSFGLIQGGKK